MINEENLHLKDAKMFEGDTQKLLNKDSNTQQKLCVCVCERK